MSHSQIRTYSNPLQQSSPQQNVNHSNSLNHYNPLQQSSSQQNTNPSNSLQNANPSNSLQQSVQLLAKHKVQQNVGKHALLQQQVQPNNALLQIQPNIGQPNIGSHGFLHQSGNRLKQQMNNPQHGCPNVEQSRQNFQLSQKPTTEMNYSPNREIKQFPQQTGQQFRIMHLQPVQQQGRAIVRNEIIEFNSELIKSMNKFNSEMNKFNSEMIQTMIKSNSEMIQTMIKSNSEMIANVNKTMNCIKSEIIETQKDQIKLTSDIKQFLEFFRNGSRKRGHDDLSLIHI